MPVTGVLAGAWDMFLSVPNNSYSGLFIEMKSQAGKLTKSRNMETHKVNDDCSGHPKNILGETDMKILAEMIGDLHYETLAELFSELYLKVNEDGTKDYNAGRKKIGRALFAAANKISDAAYCMQNAWFISKKFMK